MFLKRVTLSGFKSFADRVDFDFGQGVTCIVGPNGCGKSNVLDSLKWVLGEQSARSLRGRQMIDMIFAGSSTRRSSSVAQVDLVFGNSDRTLALDQDEVTVTRKLYRSGESEYLLCNTTARLKDVRELFMDTGVGVDAYSVIEQGRVDSLLQSSPIERRIIFEEAAGISKYKARKREAERKLDRASQNLLRVEDIIEELERRLRSVKLQAGKARNFQQYEARLNELRSVFSLAEYHRLTQTREQLAGQVRELSDKVTSCKTEIGRHEAQEAETADHLDRLVEQIAATDNQLVQARSNQAAQDERVEAGKHRIEEQRTIAERSKERLSADNRRLDESRAELAAVEESGVELQRQTEELHARIDKFNDDDRDLARDLAQAQAVLEEEKAGIIDLLRQSAQVHNEIVRLNSHRESLVGQKGRLSARDAQIASELERHFEQKASLDGRVRGLESTIAEQTEALEVKKAEAARIDGVRQRLVDELASLKESRSALASRRELLEDLQSKREGVGAGVRQLLEAVAAAPDREEQEPAADAGELPWNATPREPEPVEAIVGLVADLVDADVEHARIVEAALGDRDQYLVALDSSALLALVNEHGPLAGRMTALCMDRLPPVINPRDFSECSGFVARAIDLVRVPSRFDTLAGHLFGKTVVVEDLDAALDIAAGDNTGHRFVTVAGEVVEADGRMSLGPATAGSGMIFRRSELRDIEAQMVELDGRLDALAGQLDRTKAEASHLDTLQQELRAAIYESNTAKVEARAELQTAVEAIERLSGEQPLIAREVALIEQQIEEVLTKSEQSGKALEALERQNEEREKLVVARQDHIEEVAASRQQVQAQLTEAKVAAGQLAEKRAAAADTVNALRRSLQELEASALAAEHDIAQCHARIEDAQRVIAAGKEELASLATRIVQLDEEASGLRQKREDLRAELQDRARELKATRDQLETAESSLHSREMSLAETNVRREDLVSRVRDELEIDLVERYGEYEYEEQDWEQVENEIAELRQKMTRLGNVNLGAIDELAELEERHGFLTGQRDDLNTSRRQLEQLIERLDGESKERFSTAFQQIRENFRALFRKLFGGGRADIVLEDEENPLDCGIEIVAQPPGKDLQVISLMSGGEKSLTAIALLMSIFKCRPAPFAILDEVDAALDEANNDRFNRIIQEFVSESQFIVITHSKRTMSIAEQLYGVTMQEPGVSTRVSVKLADADVA